MFGVDLRRHRFGAREVQVGQGHLGAVPGQHPRRRSAQALGPAGDEGLLALDPAFACLRPCVSLRFFCKVSTMDKRTPRGAKGALLAITALTAPGITTAFFRAKPS